MPAPISPWYQAPLVAGWHLRATCMAELPASSWERKALSLPSAFQLPRPQLLPMAIGSSCGPGLSAGSHKSRFLGYPSACQLQWPQAPPLAQGGFNSSRLSEAPCAQAPSTPGCQPAPTVPSCSVATVGPCSSKQLPQLQAPRKFLGALIHSSTGWLAQPQAAPVASGFWPMPVQADTCLTTLSVGSCEPILLTHPNSG